jgi:hypothetical protein
MSKMACMTHLDIWNISYGQKKGQFDSRPLKVKNRPNFLAFRWRATYRWKALDKSYNFASNLSIIEGLHTKLWARKVARVLVVGISGLPFGSPETKWHLGASTMAKHRVYYNVVASPKFGPWWVLLIYVCPWFVHAPTCSKYAVTNLLFGLCRSVWVIKVLVNLPSPISELQHVPLPPKCC